MLMGMHTIIFLFFKIQVHVQQFSFNSLSTMTQWAYSQSNHILNTKWKKKVFSLHSDQMQNPYQLHGKLSWARHMHCCGTEALNAMLCYACCSLWTQCSQNHIYAVTWDGVSNPSNWPLSILALHWWKTTWTLKVFFSASQIPLRGSQHDLVSSYCSTPEATEFKEEPTRQKTHQAIIWLEWFHRQ